MLNNNHNIKIKSFIGDGSYDSNEDFKYLKEKSILPVIKVKRNSIISSNNSNVRNIEVGFQTKDIINGGRKESMGNDGQSKQYLL